MLVLGIETSCDDTAISVVEDGFRIHSSLVSSQMEHAAFGGIVPEIAARKHIEKLPDMLPQALAAAGVELAAIDAVGVTRGPGLVGALLAGWCFARGLARARELPYVGVHHLAAHVHGALMPALEASHAVPYPLLALVVSGGHTALYHVIAPARYRLLGQTRDDAAGEAFDKVAALLGLGFPGGPAIDRLAAAGDPQAVPLPRSNLGLDFSFSGLKTAVRRVALAAKMVPGTPEDPAVLDLVASFQAAAIDQLLGTTQRALELHAARGLVLAGGVAANRTLRRRFADVAAGARIPLFCSPPSLSTDNAAMIAGAAYARLRRGECDPWAMAARANWPLA